MSTRPCENQIEQEARRVLRRLAAPRQLLLARRQGDFAVARGPGAVAASRLVVEAAFVRAFLEAGWIAGDGPGRHVITEAGLAFVTRSFGGEDAFAAQHRLMQSSETGDRRIVQVNAGESPLARLQLRGLVDGTQFAAGEKLRRDFSLGQLEPRMGVNWEAPVVSGGHGPGGETISDIAMAARQRLSRAMAAVGPGLSDLLFDVCCHLTALERVEEHRGWSRRSARVVLKIALDRLAVHYGLGMTGGSGKIRSWAAEEKSA